jgi:hypothetical protein
MDYDFGREIKREIAAEVDHQLNKSGDYSDAERRPTTEVSDTGSFAGTIAFTEQRPSTTTRMETIGEAWERVKDTPNRYNIQRQRIPIEAPLPVIDNGK